MSVCEKCDLEPCACRWIIQLGRGGNWEWRRSEALRNVGRAVADS